MEQPDYEIEAVQKIEKNNHPSQEQIIRGNQNQTAQGNSSLFLQGDDNQGVFGKKNTVVRGNNNWTFGSLLNLEIGNFSALTFFMATFLSVVCLAFFFLLFQISNKRPETSNADSGSFEEQLLREAYSLLDEGDLDNADRKVNEAMALLAESPEPLYLKSLIATERSNNQVSLEYINKALSRSDDHAPSMAQKIRVMLLIGGKRINDAEIIAEEYYGYSADLDMWLECLSEKEIFQLTAVTDSELSKECPF